MGGKMQGQEIEKSLFFRFRWLIGIDAISRYMITLCGIQGIYTSKDLQSVRQRLLKIRMVWIGANQKNPIKAK